VTSDDDDGGGAVIGVLNRLPRAVVTRADRVLPGGRLRVLLAAVTALLAIGCAAGVTVLTLSTTDTMRAEQAGQEATSAVLDLTPKLLNFDYRTIDDDIARAESVTTGDYWAQNGLAGTLKPVVIAEEASTRTVVQAAGVAEAQPDRVVVLVFLNQTTSGKNLPAPRVDSRVARVTAAHVEGKWLLAGFEPL
jgi:Mce-associated membrane protein